MNRKVNKIVESLLESDTTPPHYFPGNTDDEIRNAARNAFTAYEYATRTNRNHPLLWQVIKGSPYEAQYRQLFNIRESVAVDLDGTLAKDSGWKGPEHIGEPVKPMLDLVKKLLDDGEDVVIFTARVHDGEKSTKEHIKQWLKDHDLPDLEITNEKRPDMEKFYDDKAVSVDKNKGVTEGFFDRITGHLLPEQLKAEVEKLVSSVKPFHVSQAWHQATAGRPEGRVDPTDASYAASIIRDTSPQFSAALAAMHARVRRRADQEAIETAVFSRLRDIVSGESREPYDVVRGAASYRKANRFFGGRKRRPGLKQWMQRNVRRDESLLLESPTMSTLEKNKVDLEPDERSQVMKAKAVWPFGKKGADSPAVHKAVVNGKAWYWSSTHRLYHVDKTLAAAIKNFFKIVEPSG